MTASLRQRENGAGVSAEGKRAVHAIKWAECRRYITLEGLKPVSDDPLIRLPAVVA